MRSWLGFWLLVGFFADTTALAAKAVAPETNSTGEFPAVFSGRALLQTPTACEAAFPHCKTCRPSANNPQSCQTCLSGYDLNSQGQCVDHDDCAPNPCQNAGTCTDGLKTFTCGCPLGFKGATCQTSTCYQLLAVTPGCIVGFNGLPSLVGPPVSVDT
ncbi:hypothetical protein WJX72_004680 [[Myrmecia] bisecta]|uniref:EGF-like domain-containing protein n=1 Tax=[Myrmecia] bisecta TaxID=41462 RepID=A0AAW1Q3X2_9CHLO